MKTLLRVTAVCGATALMLTAANTQAQNILVNGGFEDAGGFVADPGAGVNQGWAASFGPNASVQSTDFAQNGTYSLMVSLSAGQDWNPAGTYSIVSGVNAGVSYSLSGYFYATANVTGNVAGTGPVDVQLQFLDSSLANLSTIETGWSALGTLGQWNSFNISGVAPAGATHAAVYLMFMEATQAGTESMYFDSISLQAVPEPTTLALLGLGSVALLAIRRRKN